MNKFDIQHLDLYYGDFKALKDINYSGYFTLEASSYLEAFTPETTQKGLCDLAASAKRLSDMFEAL